ncbi:MAG: deoxyribodipyrimidine photo-lyase, partial [Planctomycetes bacterium]|nr:deoxyribodipyrimidine photo-lyase [Planctomycetota bacterium]
IVRIANAREEIPILARELKVDRVYANHDYEPCRIERDIAVRKALAGDGRELLTFKDHIVFEKMKSSINPVCYLSTRPTTRRGEPNFAMSTSPKCHASDTSKNWPARRPASIRMRGRSTISVSRNPGISGRGARAKRGPCSMNSSPESPNTAKTAISRRRKVSRGFPFTCDSALSAFVS